MPPPQVGEELAATDIGEEHVEETLVFAAPCEVHQEWVVDFLNIEKKNHSWWKVLAKSANESFFPGEVYQEQTVIFINTKKLLGITMFLFFLFAIPTLAALIVAK